MKRILNVTMVIFLLLACTTTMSSQMTIGVQEAPVAGALLQLKENNGEGANSAKGLLLPRVNLTSISDLYPMFETGYDKATEDPMHEGMVVFNLNENLMDGDGAGIYSWDGKQWMGIGLAKKKISFSASDVYVSPTSPSADVVLTVFPEDLEWDVIESGVLGSSSNTAKTDLGGGKYSLRFFAGLPGTDYGAKNYKFLVKNTTKTFAELNVHYINLEAKNIIKMGENSTYSSQAAVNAIGGDEDWVIVDYSKDAFNWTKTPTKTDGALSFTLGAAKVQGPREGWITVAHINDPSVFKMIHIVQTPGLVTIPEFDYIVIRYENNRTSYPSWENQSGQLASIDLDTSTEIQGTGNSNIDGISIGALMKVTADKGQAERKIEPGVAGSPYVFFYGGDKKDSKLKVSETAYLDVKSINTYLNSLPTAAPGIFTIDMYATWFKPTQIATSDYTDVKVTIRCYKGGEMVAVPAEFTYKNVGGEEVLMLEDSDLKVTTFRGNLDFRENYTKLLQLEFDRIDYTGVLKKFK